MIAVYGRCSNVLWKEMLMAAGEKLKDCVRSDHRLRRMILLEFYLPSARFYSSRLVGNKCQTLVPPSTRGNSGLSFFPKDTLTRGRARRESNLQYSDQGLTTSPLHHGQPNNTRSTTPNTPETDNRPAKAESKEGNSEP